jgi:pimeloyl-ACP methyl ester carboxylesterase/DNA-binding SARP family transcriptional activator
MALELRLCGELEVRRDGRVIPLPQSVKTRALLAYLVMNKREHRRQQLSDLLWDVADDPRGELRWCLSKLRAVLDDEHRTRIIAERESIRADTSDMQIDAGKILALEIDKASIDELEAACASVRGDFCEGIDLSDFYGFHAWCIGQRQDLRRRHARMRDRLVKLLAPQPEQALPHSRTLTQLVPESEAVHAQHVRLLRALGHTQEAVEYRRSARGMLEKVYAQRAFALLDRAFDDSPTDARSGLSSASAAASLQLNDGDAEPPGQHIRFCKSADGTGIAFAEVGSGATLVKVANWISHLEHEFRSPVWRHLIRELSRGYRLIRYDQRGNGLSDRKVHDVSCARQVEDLEAVMDAAGCERVPLLGVSQGCAIAVEYAVRHPERVSHLVLYGGFALGWAKHSEALRKAVQAVATTMRTGWGQENPAFRQVFTSLFIPHATREAADWFNEMQRVSSDGETAASLLLAVGEYDVRDKLGAVRCPTLVMHLESDQMVPFAEGKRLAAGIPGARLVPLQGENHLPLESDACFPKMMAEIHRFLAG